MTAFWGSARAETETRHTTLSTVLYVQNEPVTPDKFIVEEI